MIPIRLLSFEERAANALSEELGVAPATLVDRVEALVAVTRAYGMAEDDLVLWIRERRAGKEWSLVEWRDRCIKVENLRSQLGLTNPGPDQSAILCRRCQSSLAVHYGDAYFCVACGEMVERVG